MLMFFFLFWKLFERGAVAFLKGSTGFLYWDGSTRAPDFFVHISTRRYRRDGTRRSHRIVLEHYTGSATRSKAKLTNYYNHLLIHDPRTTPFFT